MAFASISPSGPDDDNKDLAEINIIPLVDIMLVLLIIFMVAAPLSISGIHVQLPRSQAKGGQVDQKKIILSIDEKGDYFIDKTRIQPEHLEAKIEAVFAVRDEKELYIRADKNVSYGRVVDAMTAAKLAGVRKLSMLTTAPASPR
ncbi:MAG: biopolymer transporter ExbD [Deltaproteobacteria bacterium]|nr:biopolymer transporter ExbD [Deltaproteobacteria bacterium]